MTAMPRLAPLILRPGSGANAFSRNTAFTAAIGTLLKPPPVAPAPGVPRRTKIWDLSGHIHCSIIGTCLSTGELRQILLKGSPAAEGASDHELHSLGVQLAGQRDGLAKLLHKALDRRHRVTLNRFDKAATVDEVRALWREAARNGDIPGAYWAAVTHPASTSGLVREIFGDVHMLSHLVGAANRADIRRLKELETENAELRDKLGRQQARLHEGITSRDARIQDLTALLARQIADESRRSDETGHEAALDELVGDLERRLRSESGRRAALQERFDRLSDELGRARARAAAAERREEALREELESVEASLGLARPDGKPTAPPACLAGRSVLYVGGRPDSVGHLRALGERFGVRILHHDGGVDDRSGLLAGAISRADVVMFPVDCVSHDAVATVKRLCRQTLKPYVPLRSAGMGSFVAALGGAVVAAFQGSMAAE